MSRFLLVEERDYSCCSTRTTSLLPPRQRLDTGARNAEYAAHTPLPMTRCFLDDTRFTNGAVSPRLTSSGETRDLTAASMKSRLGDRRFHITAHKKPPIFD